MREHELLFLGLMQDGPKHGYQLKKLMQEISATFAGIKTDSVYYPLKRMLKGGLVTQKQAKEGRRPKKYVYAITEKGKNEFRKLLIENLLSIERPYFSIDLSLYFLNHIPEELRQRNLKIRLKLLNRLKKSLTTVKNTLPANSAPHHRSILEHNQELLDAEIAFITRLAASS